MLLVLVLNTNWFHVQGSKLNEGLSKLDKSTTLKAESWSHGKNVKAMMKLRIRNNMIRNCIDFG